MIVFAIHLHQLCLEVSADVGKNLSEARDSVAIKDAPSSFCDEDQVRM